MTGRCVAHRVLVAAMIAIGSVGGVQAQQRLEERFQRAEKTAMQAPVKLIIPLIMFIFPLTFVILLFPIVVKFMGET